MECSKGCWPGRVFQIDGNFGISAGLIEMLVQSHADEIQLLPALPKAWAAGTVKGLCARGGYEVDIEWKEGKLAGAEIRAKVDGECTVRYGEKTAALKIKKGKKVRVDANLK